MVDVRSSSSSSVSSASSISSVELPTHRRSLWRFLLPVVWAGLAARLVVAFRHHESVREDFLSLALVAFFMTTALLGSRLWLWLQDHWSRPAFSRRSAA